MKIYYRIWVDCILRAKSIPANKDNWPFATLIIMSMALSLNFMLVIVFVQKLVGVYFYEFEISVLPNGLGDFLEYMILYYAPAFTLNYFLVFYRDKYKAILEQYDYKNGRLFGGYLLVSFFSPVVIVMMLIK